MACLPDDRFVLRRASPIVTLGGGRALDPWAWPVRHRERISSAVQLARLDAGGRDVYLVRAGLRGLSRVEAERRGCLLAEDDPEGLGILLGDRAFHASVVERLRDAVVGALERYHATNPLSPGAKRKELVTGPLKALDDRVLEALLEWLAARGAIRRGRGRYQAAGFELALDPGQRAAADRIEALTRRVRLQLEPPHALLAAAAHRDADAIVHYLLDQGVLQRVGPFMGHGEVLAELAADVRGWLRSEGSFTPSQAKERWGLTRKHLIPLLEWLDARRVTRRIGDARRAGTG